MTDWPLQALRRSDLSRVPSVPFGFRHPPDQIMMVQTRPRSSQESSPALTAATLRAQTPQHLPERSSERSSSARSSSERSSERSPSRSDSLPRRKENERHASRSSTVSQPTVSEIPPSDSAGEPVPVGVSGAAVASTEDGDAMDSRDGALDGAKSEVKQGADRETMVYEGSVRSGQQVGGARGWLVFPRLGLSRLSCLALSRLVS